MTIDLGGGGLRHDEHQLQGQADHRLRRCGGRPGIRRELDDRSPTLAGVVRDETMWRHELFGKPDNGNRCGGASSRRRMAAVS